MEQLLFDNNTIDIIDEYKKRIDERDIDGMIREKYNIV